MTTRTFLITGLIAGLMAASSMPALAIDKPTVPVAFERAEVGGARYILKVTSPAIAANGVIPPRHVEVSPPLRWQAIPRAQTYAIIMEDADAGVPTATGGKTRAPFVHWLAWNIPATATELPEGMRGTSPSQPWYGFKLGKNGIGKKGYFGPHPPRGGPPHRYHITVLAVKGVLNLPDGATREQLFATVRGNVLGKGELIARFPR